MAIQLNVLGVAKGIKQKQSRGGRHKVAGGSAEISLDCFCVHLTSVRKSLSALEQGMKSRPTILAVAFHEAFDNSSL